MSTGEPDATETGHVRFGGGPPEKPCPSRDLAGGLPDLTHGICGSRGVQPPRPPDHDAGVGKTRLLVELADHTVTAACQPPLVAAGHPAPAQAQAGPSERTAAVARRGVTEPPPAPGWPRPSLWVPEGTSRG
jgi:hypothetical protein